MRSVKRGSGITQKTVTEYDVSGAFGHEDVGRLRSRLSEWNKQLELGGGLFGAESLQAFDVCSEILASQSELGDEDSPEDFAARIIEYIEATKASIKSGSSDAAAKLAFKAGMHWATALTKWRWERMTLTGQSSHKHLSELRDAENTRKRSDVLIRRREIEKILMSMKSGLKGGGLEIFIQARLNQIGMAASRRTIRGDLKALRESGK